MRETAPYTTARWRAARAAYLAAHPLCQDASGCTAKAELVDHLRPHRGDAALFWDEANWQGLCWSHHSRKTATRDGGFGHA